MICEPVGPLDPLEMTPAVCDCGAGVHAVPAGARDWAWVDDDGNAVVDTSPAEYRADPRGWWKRLAATDIGAYSALSAREALGTLGWTHVHRPARQAPHTGPVPYCCGTPMRYTPTGWECREHRR